MRDRDARYNSDLQTFLATAGINGGPLWSTLDGSIGKGGPFSTLEAGMILSELGYDDADGEMRGIAELIFSNMKDDGRIKTYATGTVYPCQTAGAARTLCHLGYANDERLKKTFAYFLASQEADGGWRCNASKYGHGPETKSSNPGPTLMILDAFRFLSDYEGLRKLDGAVDFLLDHWETRIPIGPCHYGIGTLFMKIEYPVVRYNLLPYVHTLSFFGRARKDRRFLEALSVLEGKLAGGKLRPESVNKKLSGYSFCAVNVPNDLVTAYHARVRENLAR